MQLYGKNYPVKQLRRRVGNMDQIAGIQLVQLDDGNARPGRAALFHTGSGLHFTVLLDRGMDIPHASFQGKAMGWRSSTGDVAPQYYEAEGIRWLRSYFGGLLTTCGLTNVGAPAPDSALNGQGLHGRIGHLPAHNVQVAQGWEGNDYVLRVTGTMRETSVFGENLTLTRTISTRLGATSIHLRDVVTNEGFRKTGLMLLYHCNIGWPALDAGSTLIAPSRRVAPRDEEARKDAVQWNRMDPPAHGYAEKVYYHDMQPERDGTVTVALANDGFERDEGFGVYIKYNTRQLPRFTQWKMMGEQEYVAGLEPCNCGVEGRHVDEELGLLDYLRPGENRTFDIEFGPLTDKAQWRALGERTGRIDSQIVEHYREFVPRP